MLKPVTEADWSSHPPSPSLNFNYSAFIIAIDTAVTHMAYNKSLGS